MISKYYRYGSNPLDMDDRDYTDKYIRQVLHYGPYIYKKADEKEMNNTNQKEISKFGKKFLDFMNNRGGAQGFVIFGLTALAILIGPYVIQTFNLMTSSSDMNTASKIIVIFGFVCVVVALICLIKMLIFVGKNTNFFK